MSDTLALDLDERRAALFAGSGARIVDTYRGFAVVQFHDCITGHVAWFAMSTWNRGTIVLDLVCESRAACRKSILNYWTVR